MENIHTSKNNNNKKEINNLIKIIYSNLVNSSLFDRVAQELIKKLHNKSNFYEYNL